MTGIAGADLFVGRVSDIAADISAFDFTDADDIAKHRFGAPEASACNNRLFHEMIEDFSVDDLANRQSKALAAVDLEVTH